MEDIKIVEYDHSYAQAVSDMWSKSSEGWNGNDMSRTAETVIREHDNSFHINVFLAVKGDEVIGYCSFDKYFLDEGALYIATLNVRTDYHGKKVGKMLVYHSVMKTCELDWPRVDLFTWPGNTKAVPLYKKCGFFWEKRDDTTHLMNFIPTVLKTEAIKDFFDEADWYENSTRVIEVKPDGRKENKFDYFEYSWEKNGKKLRVEFERTGRGLRLIETDDYLLSATVERHELVFGMKYRVLYEAVNKSGKPLDISIKGISDKNIKFDFNKSFEVSNERTVEGIFFVDEVKEDQNPSKTHPGVTAEILINGKKANFKVGIVPVYPAKMTLHVPGPQCYTNVPSECFMELHNMFPKKAAFEFRLEDKRGISFNGIVHSIELEPEKRGMITVPYILEDFVYYSDNLHVKAQLETGETVTFCKKLDVPFRGRNEMIHGESEELFEILNGPYHARLYKQNNALYAGIINGDSTNWSFPKVGKPFTAELSKRKPDRIDVFYEDSTIGFKAIYDLEDFKGIRLTMIVRLESGGFLKRNFEIENFTDNETSEDMWLSDTINFSVYRGVAPYDGKIIELGDSVTGWINNWNSDKLTENWLFSYGMDTTKGIVWNENDKLKFDAWNMFFDHNFGKLPGKSYRSTNPVTFAIGNFKNWHDFRTYALNKMFTDRPHSVRSLELMVNGKNPFAYKEFKVSVFDNREDNHEVSFTLSSEKDLFKEQNLKSKKQAEFFIEANPASESDIVKLGYETDYFCLEQKAAVFYRSEKTVRLGSHMEKEKEVIWADNGIICLKVCPEFSFNLYSMSYKNQEWLHSSFPNIRTNAWWNPWTGGISFFMSGISLGTMLEEERVAKHVCLKDNMGNLWQGIKTTVRIQKNELYRGMDLNFYYLMLPDSPVVLSFVGINQCTGRFLNNIGMYYECFFKPGNDLKECWTSFKNRDGETVKLKAGYDQYFMYSKNPVLFGSESRTDRMLVYTEPEMVRMETGVGSQLLMAEMGRQRQIKDGEKVFTEPVFFIFTKEYIKGTSLSDLNGISFDIGEFNK